MQLAAQAGAVVTATVRGADDAQIASQLGARRVIDVEQHGVRRRAGPVRRRPGHSRRETLERSYPLLRPGARLVTLAVPPSVERAARLPRHRYVFHRHAGPGRTLELAELVDCGALQVTIAATFPLADGRAAFESGRMWIVRRARQFSSCVNSLLALG